MNFDRRLQEGLKDFPPGRRYLIGISGGRDSVALLHGMRSHGYVRLVVCHLDHALRGRASRGDAAFVRRLAEKMQLLYESERTYVRSIAETTRQSLETAGRTARLEFFTRVARRRRCPTIFLAHHADDQVETFLLRLFRGAGGRGLGAMREASQIGKLRLVRPLLGVWRSEIDEYIAQHGLKFREDASNADLEARRNRLRHTLIPQLEKQFGRNLRASLWRAAQIHSDEDVALEALLPNESANSAELAVAELRALPVALQRRLLLRWLRARGIVEPGFDAVERVRSLLAPDGKVAKVNLPQDRHARRRAGKIFLD